MLHEMPTLASSAHAHSTYAADALFANAAVNAFNSHGGLATGMPVQKVAHPKKETAMPARRLVQVFIADPNENVPLEQSVLYRGEQKLTDATDQELFFEIEIKTILEKHNAARVKVIDKKVKERTEYLEPAKIRDLKMVVVTVATF